jgi:hypothetical protein
LNGDRRVVVAAAGIVVVGLLAHGLALRNDAVFWDGWIEWMTAKSGNWQGLRRVFTDSGLPHFGWFHEALLRSSQAIGWYRALTIGAWLVYTFIPPYIAWRYCAVPGRDAFLFACVAVAHRTLMTSVSLVTVPYFVCAALFAVAALLTFASMHASRRRQIALRVVACGLFIVSFSTQSLLVPVYVVLLIVVLCEMRERSLRAFVRTSLSRAELALVPVLFFMVKGQLFRPQGPIYGQYNTIHINGHTPSYALDFIEHGILNPIGDGLSLFHPALIAVLAMIVALWWAWPGVSAGAAERTNLALLLFIALLFVVASALPYVLVGKPPTHLAWTWRNALLVPPALGVVVLGVLRAARAIDLRAAPVAAALVAVIALGEVRASQDAHATLLGRAAAERGLVLHLREQKPSALPSVVWFDEDIPVFLHEPVRFYEWSGFFFDAWGQTGATAVRFGRTVTPARLEEQAYFGNTGLDLHAPNYKLTVRLKQPFDATVVGRAYASLLGDERDAFARSLLNVHLEMIDPPPSYLDTVRALGGDPAKVKRVTP